MADRSHHEQNAYNRGAEHAFGAPSVRDNYVGNDALLRAYDRGYAENTQSTPLDRALIEVGQECSIPPRALKTALMALMERGFIVLPSSAG